MSQLAEQHGNKLRPAGEPLCPMLGAVLLHDPIKLVARKVRKDLAEKAGYCYHVMLPFGSLWTVFGKNFLTLYQMGALFERLLKSVLDKSD